LENVAADQFLTIRQDPAQYASQIALQPSAARPWQKPKTQTEPAVPKLSPDELEKLLSEMEATLRKSLDGYKIASSYRARCAAYDQHDRAIKFFQELLAKDPASQRARLELACAFVDKIPTCGGMAAIVSKGTLARKSLDQLDAYLSKEPDSWLGHYTRGMNHLHWPRALMHSADAAKDFVKCVELQEKRGPAGARAYHLRSHVCLGDACGEEPPVRQSPRRLAARLESVPRREGVERPPRHQGRHATAEVRRKRAQPRTFDRHGLVVHGSGVAMRREPCEAKPNPEGIVSSVMRDA
jgi:hypothetical protein